MLSTCMNMYKMCRYNEIQVLIMHGVNDLEFHL